MRTNKWYMIVFFHLLKVSVNNGWLLYRRHREILRRNSGLSSRDKDLSLLQFQSSVAFDLINCDKMIPIEKKRGRPSLTPEIPPEKKQRKSTAIIPLPSNGTRYDCLDHFPTFKKSRNRCRLCQKHTVFLCTKCNIHLCCVPERNCFLTFHKTQ